MLAVAFDPSIAKTGWCIAQNGNVWRMGKITTSSKDPMHVRLSMIAATLDDIYMMAFKAFQEWSIGTFQFDLCLIEDWEKRNARMEASSKDLGKHSMIKCATAAGLIFGTMQSYALDVRLISKGRIKKNETRLLAIDRGIIRADAPKNVEDALDAYQLLVCAGVCK